MGTEIPTIETRALQRWGKAYCKPPPIIQLTFVWAFSPTMRVFWIRDIVHALRKIEVANSHSAVT